ncbi:MAG: YdcF family protein [Chloroflexi bacterium]|nr:YdcF family protein [Chloroflexota bacterium]
MTGVAETLVHRGEAPLSADVLAIHGGGDAVGTRAAIARELLHSGIAPIVVTLGGRLPPGGPNGTYARASARRLDRLGVGADRIIEIASGSGTVGEITELRDHAVLAGWRRVILISDWWHTRRISAIASRTLDRAGIAWSLAAAPSGDSVTRWWLDPTFRRLVIGEWMRLGVESLRPIP